MLAGGAAEHKAPRALSQLQGTVPAVLSRASPDVSGGAPAVFEQSLRPCLERSQEGGQVLRVWREAARIIGDTGSWPWGTEAELDLLSTAKCGWRRDVCPRCERTRAERGEGRRAVQAEALYWHEHNRI